MKAETIPSDGCATDLTVFLKQDLTKSDRPDLTSAKNVVSGGKVNHFKCIHKKLTK